MLLRGVSPILPWLVEHAVSIFSRCQKRRDGRTPFDRLHGKKPTQEFVPFGEKVLARPMPSEPLNRMNPRYKFRVWLGVRNNSVECFVETAEGVFRAREVRRLLEQQDRWGKEAINNSHCHHHQCRVREPECSGRESPGRTSKPSKPLQDARVATRSDLESEQKAHSDPCRVRIEDQNDSGRCRASRWKKRGVERGTRKES